MSNPTELPDLERLEALARAATPGPWSWWTSNSVLRLTGDDGIDGGVLHAYSHRGHADICCGESDRAFIAAANPAAVLALIATARRNERMFMAACVDLGLINEALGLDPEDGGADPILGAIEELKEARRAQPEGEAPQAGLRTSVRAITELLKNREWADVPLEDPDAVALFDAVDMLVTVNNEARPSEAHLDSTSAFDVDTRAAEAAYGYLAAQHAESGAPALDGIEKAYRACQSVSSGFDHDSGERLGARACIAAVKELYLAAQSQGAHSAPGTPEAPADTARLDFMIEHEAFIAHSRDAESCRVFHRDDEGDHVPMMGWVPEAWAKSAREAIDKTRAAQLDGGQGEGKAHADQA